MFLYRFDVIFKNLNELEGFVVVGLAFVDLVVDLNNWHKYLSLDFLEMIFHGFLDFTQDVINFIVVSRLKTGPIGLFVLKNGPEKFLVLRCKWLFDLLEFLHVLVKILVFLNNCFFNALLQFSNLIF